MDDVALVQSLDETRVTAARAREHSAAAGEDLAEKDAAVVVYRQAIALQRVLEQWLMDRAYRAAATVRANRNDGRA